MAATNLQGTNAKVGGVFEPVPNEQGEEFSPGGEEVYVPECQTGESEQTPGGRQRCEERVNNPGEEPEREKIGRRDGPNRPATLWEERGPGKVRS
ncbi:hypothetical protein NDU88_003191 [Pleurodeles waltl]|uniref:Uncharacterized protein n=1 Tax=Pleurodeles waltl TaxID=8319 RepID=A0AAV7KU75_PLEWA|nr:hypothetical protein NDU88_003191 [Pleurodeles waltl]